MTDQPTPDRPGDAGRHVQGRPTRVLVTGGSIAGPALARWLDEAGFAVTLLERSPVRREAGQNVDIRGLGRDVLRRMGLEEAVRAHLTGEVGTRFVRSSGEPLAVFPQTDGQDGPTAEIEILRGILSGLVLDQVPDSVEQRYGDFVVGVDQDADGVDVRLESGASERYDLLLVAEGRSSRTRRLLFADETSYRDRGVTLTFGTVDRTADDTDHWDWFTATGSRVVSVRPDNLGTIRASLSFASPPFGFESAPVERQLAELRERFAGAGWITDRVLDGFEARPDEFYSQRVEQVVMSTWSKGRVAVVGDAAWGSGPTGMGTTLALVGAYVLAGELSRSAADGDVTAALTRYEDLLRDYVDDAQGIPPGGFRAMHPRTALAREVLRGLLRFAGWEPVRTRAQRLVTRGAKSEPVLPDYGLGTGRVPDAA